MIRLYPQVIKSEQDIQELRRRLAHAERHNDDQRGELVQAGRRIEDLHAELGCAEQAQRDLVRLLGELEGETLALRGTAQAAEKGVVCLRQQLVVAREEHLEKLRRLAKAECDGQRIWSEMSASQQQVQKLDKHLDGVCADSLDLAARLQLEELSCADLRVEWRTAVVNSQEQRVQLEEAEATSVSELIQAASIEVASAVLCEEAARLEAAGIGCRVRLAAFEGADARHSEWLERCARGSGEREELQTQLMGTIVADGALQQEVEMWGHERNELVAELRHEHHASEARAAVYNQLEAQFLDLQAELAAGEQESTELRSRASTSAELGDAHVAEMHGRLDEVRTQGADARGQSARFESEGHDMRAELMQTEVEVQELRKTMAGQDSARRRATEQRDELKGEFEELASQWRCLIA